MQSLRNVTFPNELEQKLASTEVFSIKHWGPTKQGLYEQNFLQVVRLHFQKTSDSGLIQKQDKKVKAKQNDLIFQIITSQSFLQMKSLKLIYCYISSIEPIAALSAPLLNELILTHNNIVSFKPLVKCKFNLEKLMINSQDAQIDQLSHLTRTKFPVKIFPIDVIQAQCPERVNTIMIRLMIKIQPYLPMNPSQQTQLDEDQILPIQIRKWAQKFGIL